MDTAPPPAPQAIEISQPADPTYRAVAMLLGTLASPPSHPRDPHWREAIAAFRHQAITTRAQFEPSWGGAVQQIFPEDVLEPSVDLRRTIDGHLRKIDNRALKAAHAMMPLIVAERARLLGLDMRLEPAAYRAPQTQLSQIDRVQREDIKWREQLLERDGMTVPDAPDENDALPSDKNFLHRKLRPVRSVLHLAAGLAQELEAASWAAADLYGTASAWEAAGYATYEVSINDKKKALPMMTIDVVLGCPGLALRAFRRAEMFEAAVMSLQSADTVKLPYVIIRLT